MSRSISKKRPRARRRTARAVRGGRCGGPSGTIDIASEPGEGSTFTVVLPKIPSPP